MKMLLGVIADDVTGASDIANTLAKAGLATTQFFGVPARPAEAQCEAGIVALKSRSIPADEAVSQSLAALRWLKAQGCTQFVFKYCSTFDSTPRGNIGPVGEALAEALGVSGVVACPAFPAAGRTVYQGHLFVHDRLLNESGLQNHPLNPMTDPDLRRWLRRQTKTDVGLVAHATVSRGADAIGKALGDAGKRGETLVIVDAITEDDLLAIGLACDGATLLTGGSGIAMGLPANFIRRGLASGKPPRFASVEGPAAILAGSCSQATRGQIALHAKSHPVFPIDAEAVVTGNLAAKAVLDFMAGHRDDMPLAYSSAAPAHVARLQDRHGTEKLAAALDGFFADVAEGLTKSGVTRLVVAGGETSGAVMGRLGIDAVTIGPEIDPGVPILAASGGRKLGLALKSGNFGAEDFFAKAVTMLAGAR
jgi:uncharacterized protein YgbK (DUF1537 family)